MFVGKEGTAAALTLIDVEAEIDSCYFLANQLGTFKDSVKTLNLVISDVIYIVVKSASSSVHVGGAMFISHSNATIIHTVFRNNSAEIGGDIFIEQESNVSIISCSFYDGGGSVFGGAIFMEDSSVTMEECQVINKTATVGGGVASSISSLAVYNSNFTSNLGYDHGGALFLYDSEAEVHSCTFDHISAGGGGGLHAHTGKLLVEQSYFMYNEAFTHAGAVDLYNNTAALRSCLFQHNSAFSLGAALFFVKGTNASLGS